MITSSAEAWLVGEMTGNEGGYNYTASKHGPTYIDFAPEKVDTYLNHGPRLAGTFNLPNCAVARTEDFDLEHFGKILQGGGEQPLPPETYDWARQVYS